MVKLFQARQTCWWLAVLTVVVLIKHHYSTASIEQLQWVFLPLALILEWLTGHSFIQLANHEWLSYSADIRLVKSCAGINFLAMSFLGYAWVLRPENRKTHWLSQLTSQTRLISACFIAAWISCLLANSLRIIIAMQAAQHHWQLPFITLDDEQTHRLLGMAIYVPLLCGQMLLDKRSKSAVFIAPIFLYFLMVIAIPLLTGNALKNPLLFGEHVVYIVFMSAVMVLLLLLTKVFHKLKSASPS